jgi:hypothetical protein
VDINTKYVREQGERQMAESKEKNGNLGTKVSWDEEKTQTWAMRDRRPSHFMERTLMPLTDMLTGLVVSLKLRNLPVEDMEVIEMAMKRMKQVTDMHYLAKNDKILLDKVVPEVVLSSLVRRATVSV